MIIQRPRDIFVMLAASALASPCAWGQADSRDYSVSHPFTVDLNEKEIIRGVWGYRLDSTAVSRSGGSVHRNEKATIGPFETDTDEAKSLTAASGGASATSNASMSFSQKGGFHQVDGVATVGGDGRYARAFSSSSLGLNTGVKRANGKIRWSPSWQVDRIHGTSRAGRDPVDLVFRDRVTGEEKTGRLFDVQFAFGEGGRGGWDAGKLSMQGVDGMFALEMDSPYLTSPTGRVLLEFDKAGLVTRSEATGIFVGHVPSLGEAATMNLDVAGLTGSADGLIDLAYDFGMEGDLGLDVSFTGDGMAQATGGSSPATVTTNDFSRVAYQDVTRLLQGSTFWSNQSPNAIDIIRGDNHDAYSGYADLSRHGTQPVSTLAFDAASSLTNVRGIDARFDIQITDGPAAPDDPRDGIALLLLPTEHVGLTGAIEPSILSDSFSSLAPGADGGLAIGIDSIDANGQSMAIVSLTWNDALVGQTQFPWDITGAVGDDWHGVQLRVDPHDDAAQVSVLFRDEERDQLIPVLQRRIPNVTFPQGVRPLFATTAQGNQGHRSLDNVFIDYLADVHNHLAGDFDANHTLDVVDLDLLVAQIQSHNPNMDHFDLNQDGEITQADVATWVHDLKQSWFGDANLDQVFDSSDMISVFQAGLFERDVDASWSQGDWNGDLRFETGDLIVAFQDGGYEMGTRPRMAVSAVPEPRAAILMVLGAIVSWACGRRRRQRS